MCTINFLLTYSVTGLPNNRIVLQENLSGPSYHVKYEIRLGTDQRRQEPWFEQRIYDSICS